MDELIKGSIAFQAALHQYQYKNQRDKFAAAALTGLVERMDKYNTYDQMANVAYSIADAMMEARER